MKCRKFHGIFGYFWHILDKIIKNVLHFRLISLKIGKPAECFRRFLITKGMVNFGLLSPIVGAGALDGPYHRTF